MRLSGYEKIAVLLGELGVETSERLLQSLHLSTEEIIKIWKKIASLGEYNPNNSFHVDRENTVLEEFKKFGEFRGIYREVPHNQPQPNGFIKVDGLAEIRDEVLRNPDDIANVLRSWINEE